MAARNMRSPRLAHDLASFVEPQVRHGERSVSGRGLVGEVVDEFGGEFAEVIECLSFELPYAFA